MTKKFVLSFIAAFIIGVQIYCMIAYKELYPFSSFPMYKGRLSEHQHFVCEVFVIDKNHQSIPYRKVGRATIDYFYRFNFCDHSLLEQLEIHRSELERIAQEYIQGLRQRDDIQKVILKINYWEHFNYQTISKPSREFILYETPL